jgi:hypothetical protein
VPAHPVEQTRHNAIIGISLITRTRSMSDQREQALRGSWSADLRVVVHGVITGAPSTAQRRSGPHPAPATDDGVGSQ